MIRKFVPQKDLDQATMLYISSFPEEERRDISQWKEMICKHLLMTTYSIIYKDSFAGFLTTWDMRDFIYGEHFAIDPAFRGKNIGGQTIQDFIKVLDKPFIIEVEPQESSPMADRRIGFYERQGLKLSNRPYLQPPYQKNGKSIPLQLMTTDAVYLEENYHTIVNTIHKEVYQKCFTFPKG